MLSPAKRRIFITFEEAKYSKSKATSSPAFFPGMGINLAVSGLLSLNDKL